MNSIDEIRNALDAGELFTAHDLAEQALKQQPHDLQLRYLAVLALARAGAVEQAAEHFHAFGLKDAVGQDIAAALRVDIACLRGRLVKDAAFSEIDATKRNSLLTLAAEIYHAVYEETGDWFPGINAATLTLLAGNDEAASNLAEKILSSCEQHSSKDGIDTYYREVTRAEAALVLGQERKATAALEAAAEITPRNYGAYATTRRQLRLVCKKRGIDLRIFDALPVPSVLHFVGSRRVGPPDAAAEEDLRSQVAARLAEWDIGFGYGALATWADIVVAESLLARDADLQLVLPFSAEQLKRLVFEPLGGRWPARFDHCIAHANVPAVVAEEDLNDDHDFTHAVEVATGLALLRSRFLQTSMRQLVICSAADPSVPGDAGTGWEMALPRHVIEPKTAQAAEPAGDPAGGKHSRRLAAMLFGDIKGFSKLRESQIPIFVSEILGRIATVVEGYAERILYRNTWGDGLYIVLSEVAGAACLASDLQAALGPLDRAALGLPSDLALRLGLHVGPVFEVTDPVLDRLAFMGTHVSRTARIEPVTPPGLVYVSEPFAARVALQPHLGFECEYVGQVPAAKDFGEMRMYSLKRRGWSMS